MSRFSTYLIKLKYLSILQTYLFIYLFMSQFYYTAQADLKLMPLQVRS